MYSKLIICLHIICSLFIYDNYGLTSIKKFQQRNFEFPDEPQTDPQGFPQGATQGFPQGDPQGFPQGDTQGFPQGDGQVNTFGFPDEQQPSSVLTPEDSLTRQFTNGTTAPAILTPVLTTPIGVAPFPGSTPAVLVPTGQTCICVPTGSCNSTLPVLPTDGSGQIDIRIITNAPTSGPQTNIVTPPVGGISCQANVLVSCCSPGPYQCGIRYPPVAGAPQPGAGQATYGEFPWQVALLGPGSVYVGSGVLIDALNVLTVAHRAANFTTAPNRLTARFGEWNAGATNEPIPAIEYAVSRIFIHPSYNAANLKNDVAILRLSQAVPLANSPTYTNACLPGTSFSGQRCWVSGWGRNDFNVGSYQAIQKKVDVPIQPQATCQSQLAATRLGPRFVFDGSSFICAGGELGKDACTGDGGSPLVCNLGNTWFVAGLVAWGIGCGQANIPGVYVNVQTYVPWIQSTINTP